MSTLNVKYGPFSPQELDPILKWMEKNEVMFQMIKDETSENQFQRNDPANMLAQTELRTDVYLAQIFYLIIDFDTEPLKRQFEDRFIHKTEVIPIWLSRLTQPLSDAESLDKAFSKKRFWATVLIVIWLAIVAISYIFNN